MHIYIYICILYVQISIITDGEGLVNILNNFPKMSGTSCWVACFWSLKWQNRITRIIHIDHTTCFCNFKFYGVWPSDRWSLALFSHQARLPFIGEYQRRSTMNLPACPECKSAANLVSLDTAYYCRACSVSRCQSCHNMWNADHRCATSVALSKASCWSVKLTYRAEVKTVIARCCLRWLYLLIHFLYMLYSSDCANDHEWPVRKVGLEMEVDPQTEWVQPYVSPSMIQISVIRSEHPKFISFWWPPYHPLSSKAWQLSPPSSVGLGGVQRPGSIWDAAETHGLQTMPCMSVSVWESRSLILWSYHLRNLEGVDWTSNGGKQQGTDLEFSSA